MNSRARTIVLVHGLWMTPQSWAGFKRLYESMGHRVLTPAWPGLNGDWALAASEQPARALQVA